ncbi:hypothetical protein AX16_008838 [Volvariella volvacea WC 439]|nr:hypothetical protein AX16_008838 [Volvariella volvacea WC 439]
MFSALRASAARVSAGRPPSVLLAHRLARLSSTSSRSSQSQSPPPSESPSQPALARARKYAKYTGLFCLSSVFGVAALGVGIFIHDAFTYNEKHIDRVPVNPLALHPEKGGPKNLPIVRVFVGDEEDEENKQIAQRPRLVVVGGGWGAMGVLQTISPGDYHVTVVSAETFNTFTPLLPSAAVGTVQLRSLIEPIRKLIARLRGHFVHGKAVDLVMKERLIEVESTAPDGTKSNFYIPYDKLVIAVGSTSSTHGVPGLENCFQLKTIADAQAIRRRVMDNFEAASLPTTTPEERKRLLSFVICGGGPTGVETAAEIYDFCQEDIINYFPKLCREHVTIHVIQSRSHILNTYSEAISKYAEDKFKRDKINLITNARVESVGPDQVCYTLRGPNGEKIKQSIPTNFVLWSTGIAMNPFTQRISSLLPNQVHKKAIVVDAHLRVKGAPIGEIYAVGDCATLETSVVSHFMDLVEKADRDKNGLIDFGEWEDMARRIKHRIPMAEDHLVQVKELFEAYDVNKDNNLSLNELLALMQDLEKKITALPATAQVASQEGKYLGKKLHKLARSQKRALQAAVENKAGLDALTSRPTGTTSASFHPDEHVAGPFKYKHLGSLAYIGNAAVFDFGWQSVTGGLAAMYAWRSIYWSEQVSARTRALLMIDWIIRGVWGRDLSRL